MNKALAKRILNEVRRIVREILEEGTVTVYLFGSWARGNPTALSDIDIAIEAHAPLPPGSLARLRERLEESRVPYRVDVPDLDDVEPTFRQRIVKEGIRWNDSRNGLTSRNMPSTRSRSFWRSIALPRSSVTPRFSVSRTHSRPAGGRLSGIF